MRQIPVITKNLLIINVVCFLACVVLQGKGIDLNNIFGLHYWQATNFDIYQLVTYMFMHGSWTHLFFNMFTLWMFGGLIENTFGQKRFLIYYMVCGLGAALCQELSQTFYVYSLVAGQGGGVADLLQLSTITRAALNAMTTVGASGAIYGILLAFGMLYPEQRMFVFPIPFPLKAKWFVCIFAAIELLTALSQHGDGVAHVAHLGGMLFGYVLIKMWRGGHNSSFNGWDGYEIRERKTILGRIREWLHLDSHSKSDDDNYTRSYKPENKHETDWRYNEQKKQTETEIDRILDKIRRSGYASLSDEEKKKLFDQSK